jgi:hypothetical protein
MNLVSMAMQFLGPMVVNKIAGSLGMNSGLAGKAIAAIVPTILAGMIGKSSSSSGLSDLFSILNKQDTGMLGNLGNLIGGAGQQNMIDSGNNVLGSLLGGSATSALAGAVGKFAGIDGNQSKSLMGMLAPVVLGSVAQQTKTSGLDAAGLGKLLAGQKDNIAAAMPPGFSDLLGGSGLLDGVTGNLKAAAPQMAAPAAPAMGGMMKWLLPAVGALAASVFLFGGGKDHVPADKAAAPQPAAQAPAAPTGAANIVELTNQATTIIDKLKTNFGAVTNEATAKTSLPGFSDIVTQLGTLKGAAMAVPAEARSPLTSMIGAASPGIASAAEKMLGIPGVGAILKPVVDQIIGHMTDLGKT